MSLGVIIFMSIMTLVFGFFGVVVIHYEIGQARKQKNKRRKAKHHSAHKAISK